MNSGTSILPVPVGHDCTVDGRGRGGAGERDRGDDAVALAAPHLRHRPRGAWCPGPVIKELMGHADIKTTMRYVTITGSQLDAAIAMTFGQPVGNEGDEAPAAGTAQKKKPSGLPRVLTGSGDVMLALDLFEAEWGTRASKRESDTEREAAVRLGASTA